MYRFLALIGFMLLLAAPDAVFAQDIIQLMNGRRVEGKVITIQDAILTYEVKKKNKTITAELEAERVFSILYADGHSVIVYKQDTLSGGYLSPEDMRYFILGEQDAYSSYKAPLTTIAGFAFGVAGGWYVPAYFVLGVPLTYTAFHSFPKIRIDRKTVSNPQYLTHETYVMGYERVARSKKIQNALKGSVLGLAAGITASFIIFKNSEEP